MKSRKLIITLFFLVLFSLNQASAGENITVHNAWLREAPPATKVMAGYLQIENSSDKTLILISAESTEFERIEFHQSMTKDGIARMQQQNQIIITPNTIFLFEPGGYHMMLFNNTVPMREGKSTSIKLNFDSGDTLEFDTIVKKSDSNNAHQHHNHH
jgi:copper(I)-binding protein